MGVKASTMNKIENFKEETGYLPTHSAQTWRLFAENLFDGFNSKNFREHLKKRFDWIKKEMENDEETLKKVQSFKKRTGYHPSKNEETWSQFAEIVYNDLL